MRYAPGISAPAVQVPNAAPEFVVNVVYFGLPQSDHLMRSAAALASGLGAALLVHVPQVIPYPLALKMPPVAVGFAEERLRCMAALQPVSVRARFYLCRDAQETVCGALAPESIVILARKLPWWPCAENRLARRLTSLGHRVFRIPLKQHQQR